MPTGRHPHLPTKTAHRVFNTPLNAVWHTVTPLICKLLKTLKICYSIFKTACFLTYSKDGKNTLGPIIVWIATYPTTTTAKNMHDASPEILLLLKANRVKGVVEHAHAVALESVISDHMTAPKLPKPNDMTQAMQSQPFAFPTHCSSLSPQASHFPYLPPLLSANRTQATFSQDEPLATHQASLAEKSRIAHIGLANNKPKDDTAPCCIHSTLPLLTILRSGPIRKDSE